MKRQRKGRTPRWQTAEERAPEPSMTEIESAEPDVTPPEPRQPAHPDRIWTSQAHRELGEFSSNMMEREF